MQKIILFVEPIHETFSTPAKIGNLFVNRFAIDENASCEILKRFELGKTSVEMSWNEHENYENLAAERQQKGMDHFIMIENSHILILYTKTDRRLIHLRNE